MNWGLLGECFSMALVILAGAAAIGVVSFLLIVFVQEMYRAYGGTFVFWATLIVVAVTGLTGLMYVGASRWGDNR